MKAGLYTYVHSLGLAKVNPPFYALIMAAMRGADSVNAIKLKVMFPDIWDELQARYNAPGGILPEDNVDPKERQNIADTSTAILSQYGR